MGSSLPAVGMGTGGTATPQGDVRVAAVLEEGPRWRALDAGVGTGQQTGCRPYAPHPLPSHRPRCRAWTAPGLGPPRQSLPSASTAPLSNGGLKSCSLPGSLEQAFSGLVSSAPCPTAPALLTNPPHPLLFLCPSLLTDTQSSLPTRAGAWSELGLGPHTPVKAVARLWW